MVGSVVLPESMTLTMHLVIDLLGSDEVQHLPIVLDSKPRLHEPLRTVAFALTSWLGLAWSKLPTLPYHNEQTRSSVDSDYVRLQSLATNGNIDADNHFHTPDR
eukprot:scaffold35674_cov26-Prasinocladus_malaysianus.AAC.1